jgi:hypothetical protein
MIIYELTEKLPESTIKIEVTHLGVTSEDLLDLIFDDRTGLFSDTIEAIKEDMQTVRCENNSFWSSPIRQYNLDYIMQSEVMKKWNPRILLGKTMDRPKFNRNPTLIY